MILAKKMPSPMPDSIQCRFWEGVKVGFPGECWEWIGSKTDEGYGQIKIKGKSYSCHRVSYFISYGENIDESLILHSCDNRPCANPFHLFTGTHKDNVFDMHRKKRGNKLKGEDWHKAHPKASDLFIGSKNPMSVLTEEEAVEIKKDLTSGVKQLEIAKRFNVSQATVCRIGSRKTWSHLEEGT